MLLTCSATINVTSKLTVSILPTYKLNAFAASVIQKHRKDFKGLFEGWQKRRRTSCEQEYKREWNMMTAVAHYRMLLHYNPACSLAYQSDKKSLKIHFLSL